MREQEVDSTAQRSVEGTELEDLVDFVDCLDEAESLPTIAVNACDLSTLPTAMFGSSMSVCSEVDYTDLLNDIKIEKSFGVQVTPCSNGQP